MMMEAPEPTTTRDEILQEQADRLPQLATRCLLVQHPIRALDDATMRDALELSAADVLASGRELIEVPDEERRSILGRNYAYCMDRNKRYLQQYEARN